MWNSLRQPLAVMWEFDDQMNPETELWRLKGENTIFISLPGSDEERVEASNLKCSLCDDKCYSGEINLVEIYV